MDTPNHPTTDNIPMTALTLQEVAAPARPVALDVFRVAEMLAKSGYFKDVRDASQALVKILAGQEIGLGPVASILGVYITPQGKITYGATAIAAAIKASGRYNFRVKVLDVSAATLVFFEHGQAVGESTFSLADAKAAGLLDGPNKHNWQHYPRNMLFARALTNGQKWYCPDVGGGIPLYTPEELDTPVSGAEATEPGPVQPSPAQPPTTSMPGYVPGTLYTGVLVRLAPRRAREGQKDSAGVVEIEFPDQTRLTTYFFTRPEVLRKEELDWESLMGQSVALSFTERADRSGQVWRYVEEFRLGAAPDPAPGTPQEPAPALETEGLI